MKYVCLGYFEEKKWEALSESEQNALMDECFAYDDVLRKNGNFAGGEALQSPGPEPRHPADIEASGSKGGPLRDPPG
jgi:hypothetical protein